MGIGAVAKVGVAGVGGIGRYHLAGMEGIRSLVVSAICDVNPESLEEAGAKYPQAARFTQLEHMIAARAAEAVVLALPTHLHAWAVPLVLENKLHLLQEKPMAISLEEARQYLSLAERSGVVYQIATQRRFGLAFRKARELLGELGGVRLVLGSLVFPWGSGDYGWRGDGSKMQRGALLDVGYHVIDLLNWYLGPPDWVFAKAAGERPEFTASMTMHYGQGAVGQILTSLEFGPVDDRLRIYGTKGSLEVDWQKAIVRGAGGEIKTAYRRKSDMAAVYRRQSLSFVRRIATGEEPRISAQENLESVAVFDAAYRSMCTNKEESVPGA